MMPSGLSHRTAQHTAEAHDVPQGCAQVMRHAVTERVEFRVDLLQFRRAPRQPLHRLSTLKGQPYLAQCRLQQRPIRRGPPVLLIQRDHQHPE